MGSNAGRAPRRRHVLLVLVLAVATACESPRPSPSATPAGPAPSDALPAKVVGDLALEACDPGGLLPCEQQAVLLATPIADSGLSLTYSTEWADGRLDRPRWNADALGLGGWSIDVVQRYDAEHKVLLAGDGSWRVAEAVEAGGGERAVPTYDGFAVFVFDAAWRHVRTVDAVTGATLLSISYDAQGRLTGISGANAGAPVSLTVERGADGTLRHLAGAGDARTTTSVDADGRLSAIGRPDGTILSVSFDPHGLVGGFVATGRGAVRYEFDDAGRLTKATDPDGVWRTLAFTVAQGRSTITASDPDGGTATLTAERVGDAIRRTVTDTDGTVSQLDTAADGSTRLSEPDGTVTTAGAARHPRWGLAAPVITPIVETRPDGTEYRVETTTTMGATASPGTSAAWETVVTAGGQRWVDAFDPATLTFTRTDPTGRRASQTFDAAGRPVELRLPGEAPVSYAYNGEGVLASMTVGEGSAAATTSFTSAPGEVTELRPDGSTHVSVLDPLGRLRRSSTTEEQVTLVLDPAGLPLQVRAGQHPATSLGYSEAGRPTAYLPPAVGDDAWYELTTYTPGGRVATIAGSDGHTVSIEYDSAGRATSWSFDEGTSTAAYDPQSGLLRSNASPDGVTTSFAYDGWVRTGIEWSGPVDGAVRVGVNGLLLATSVAVNDDPPMDVGYDAAGLLTSIDELTLERDPQTGLVARATLGDAVTTYEFDGAMRLAATTTTSGGRTVLTVRYLRDVLGRVTGIERTDGDGTTTTSGFAYDGSGRLVMAQRGPGATSYAYDAAGNRVSSTRDGTTTASFDDRNRLVRLGNQSFRSSPDGTLLERSSPNGTTTYEFDDLGALRAATLPDGRRVEYVIDAGGRRIGRMVDGRLTDGFLYGLDDRIVAWTDGSGRVRAQFGYDDAGRLALVRQDGRELLVVTDQVGSPIALLDGASGDMVAGAAYDAWGNVLDDALAAVLPIGFAGGLADPATGLVHFGARDYDPATGRWTAPDPLRFDGGDTNLYRYAGGDPVNFADPTGTTACPAGRCAATAAGAQQLRPSPVGGRGTGGGTASGGRGPYHDRGPGGGGHGHGGGASKGKGPVSTAGGDNDGPVIGQPRPERPPSGGSVGSYKNSFTSCVFACVTETRDGWEGGKRVPGGNHASCHPAVLCAPPLPGENGGGTGGWCAGFCYGNDPDGSNGYVCIIYCSFGEPHLITADRGQFDFQAAGEFLIARSADGTFEVQARYQPSRVVRTVTMTTALTMRVGTDVVGFYRDPDSGDQSRALVINGEAIDRASYTTTLPGGGTVERLGSFATVTWADGSQVGIHLYSKWLDFSMQPSEAVAGTLSSLLGRADGSFENDLAIRDGATLDISAPDFREQLYGPFADSWRITRADSIFEYRDGESTETFQLRDFPAEHVTIDDLDARARQSAEALCRAMGVTSDPVLSTCIFDVGMTGDPTFAGSSATVAAAIERADVPELDLGTGIAREQQTTGNLVAGATDRYHFAANAGDIVYLDAGAGCTDALDWRLLRPDGVLMTFATGCTDLGRRVLPSSGEWLVEVYSDDSAAGAYDFRILTVPAPKVEAIAPGGSASGATTAVGEWHRYTLEATAGQVVYLDAEAGCDSPLSWRLLRPDGVLATFATACTDLGRRALDATGTWVIEAYSDDLDTGSYAFRVIDVPAPRKATIALGDTVTDATSRTGDWHRYRLSVAQGQVLYLDALETCTSGVFWRLLRPDGVLSTFASTCNDMGRRVLGAAGDWTIEVYADDLSFGAYSFQVIGAPAPRVRNLSVGSRVDGTIGQIGEWHRYKLSATAGQRIVIDAGTTCVPDLWWRLLRPDGVLTTFGSVCTDSDVRTLDVAGEWVVEIYSDVKATGPYSFTVKAAP